MDNSLTSAPEGFVPFPFEQGFSALIGPLFFRPSGKDVAFGFRVEDKHANPAGICHGGMMMTVADMAIGFAALVKSKRKSFPPSINNTYDFLAPARIGDWLETRIPFVSVTGSMAFADGFVFNGDQPVMRFNGICKLPRDDDPRFSGLPQFEATMSAMDRVDQAKSR